MKPDRQNIIWPTNVSVKDKKFCRRIYSSFKEFLNSINTDHYIPIAIACSGGIDSTVMAHAFAMVAKDYDRPLKKCLIYINHQLRTSEETNKDINHIIRLANELGYDHRVSSVSIDKNAGNVQALAREARYNALSDIIAIDYNSIGLVAHNANDQAETKLFQFLSGRNIKNLSDLEWGGVVFKRPMVKITREDIERYAKIWSLTWSEDSSNSTNKYTRNKIRHNLIPWIKENINPGIVEMLAGLE